MKIIVDAFGGDHAPLAVLEGCRQAIDELGAGILLTGDEPAIRAAAEKAGISLAGMEIVHAPSVIPVEEDPTTLLKKYADSSMAVGLRLLSEGRGDAFVSAGSTGALVVGATLLVKRVRGVRRTAIGTLVPNAGNGYLLVDAGANHDCRPEMLLQFALMGSAYMQQVEGVASPRVGLVNIGTEENKGTQLQLDTLPLLQAAPLNFTGNVEARGLPLGEVDVAVTDGFTGNIILKTTEGMGKFFSRELKGMIKSFPGVLGGLFLGKRQHVIRHGHASRRAADAAAHAEPVARPQLVADRAQAVVARMPAAELDADGAGVDVEFVVDDDQMVGVDAVGVAQLLDRTAGGVHVALRLGQHHIDVVVGALGRQRAALGLPVARPDLLADEVDGIEPGIMPRVRVFLPRIPQADD